MISKVYTPNAPEAIGPYSQGMVFDKLIFTSGQIPIDPSTGEIQGTTISEQTEQVMQNLKAVLEAAGSSMQQVIKATCFLSDMEHFAGFNAVYGTYLTEKPARSCVAVKELPKQVLVEVELIAYKE